MARRWTIALRVYHPRIQRKQYTMAAFPKQEVVKFQARPPAYGLVTDARKGKDGPLLRLKTTIWIIELAPGLRTTTYNEARFFYGPTILRPLSRPFPLGESMPLFVRI